MPKIWISIHSLRRTPWNDPKLPTRIGRKSAHCPDLARRRPAPDLTTKARRPPRREARGRSARSSEPRPARNCGDACRCGSARRCAPGRASPPRPPRRALIPPTPISGCSAMRIDRAAPHGEAHVDRAAGHARLLERARIPQRRSAKRCWTTLASGTTASMRDRDAAASAASGPRGPSGRPRLPERPEIEEHGERVDQPGRPRLRQDHGQEGEIEDRLPVRQPSATRARAGKRETRPAPAARKPKIASFPPSPTRSPKPKYWIGARIEMATTPSRAPATIASIGRGTRQIPSGRNRKPNSTAA